MVSTRNYAVVGLLLGIVVFLVATFAGGSIVTWVSQVQATASVSMGGLATFIGEPIKWVMLNPLFGAVVVAILWPLMFVWLLLLFIMVVVGFGAPAAQQIDRQL